MEEKAKINAYKMFIEQTFSLFKNKIREELIWKAITCHQNITMEIIDKYSDKPWDWESLSDNLNLTLEIVNKYPNKNWDWYDVSRNLNIVMDLIIKYKNDKNWYNIVNNENPILVCQLNYEYRNWNQLLYNLSQRNNLDLNFVENYAELEWDWESISRHQNLSFDFIQKHLTKDWNWIIITRKPFITMEIIDQNPSLPWCLNSLAENPNLTIEIIEKYNNHEWFNYENQISENIKLKFKTNILSNLRINNNYHWKLPCKLRYISKNPTLNIDFIEQNPFIEEDDTYDYWDWGSNGISANHCLTIEMLEKYINKNWCWDTISSNPSLNIIMLQKFPNKNWNWNKISFNPSFTMEIFDKFPNKDWNWDEISINKNLSMDIVDKYNDKPWNWNYITHNPNFTLKIYKKYPNKKWSLFGILKQLLTKHNKVELIKLKNFKNIEEELIRKTWHPKRFIEWCLDDDDEKD